MNKQKVCAPFIHWNENETTEMMMNLENVMLSERSQSQKTTHSVTHSLEMSITGKSIDRK
jgi:hypothetical protein